MHFVFSLEKTYEALRTFDVLGIDKKADIKTSTCKSVVDILESPSSHLEDLFQALRVNGILKCELNDGAIAVSFMLYEVMNWHDWLKFNLFSLLFYALYSIVL